MSLLLWILLLPVVGAAGLAAVPRNYKVVIRGLALGVTGLVVILSLWVLAAYDDAPPGLGGYRMVREIVWAESLGISLVVGVDGINLGLVVMTALVAFAAACLSAEIVERTKEFYLLLMLMTAGVLGAFLSLDIFFLYFFHELALVPTFIMIGVWGRGERRAYAAFQITIYLTIGALMALIGLIALYGQSGSVSFNLVTLTEHFAANPISASRQELIFPWLMFGFGILVSLWPFHTWAPLGYGSAPTATAMLHAGALKKFGLYALLKIGLPMLPEGARSWLPVLAWLCLGNILYCGWVAMRQRDLNLLIGNSSVAHMGFVFLGLASLTLVGITGAVVVMVAHGFLAALSFAVSGWLYRQTRSLDMDRMGGLLRQLPFLGTVMVMAMLAGCGVPGFGNFIGEILVLFGGWRSEVMLGGGVLSLRWAIVAAVWGALIIAAVYMLRAVRQIWHGPPEPAWGNAVDPANGWRRLPFLLLLGALMAIGIWPRWLTDRIEPGARQILEAMGRRPPPALASALPPTGSASEVSDGPERNPRLEGATRFTDLK
jgi:NADH-quinone oxidoreductase subunit M